MSRCPWWAHLCTRAGVTCGFYAEACCAWLGAILANAVSILVCHIKEIYGILASAKSANRLCFSNSAKSLSSIIYSGNTLYLLISVELHLSSLVSALYSQEGCLLCLRITLNILFWCFFIPKCAWHKIIQSPPPLFFLHKRKPCPLWKLWQIQKHIFKKNVACSLLHEETTINDLVCVFSVLFFFLSMLF